MPRWKKGASANSPPYVSSYSIPAATSLVLKRMQTASIARPQIATAKAAGLPCMELDPRGTEYPEIMIATDRSAVEARRALERQLGHTAPAQKLK